MIQTAGGLLNPIRVSADILKALAARATEALAGELDGVVITVPLTSMTLSAGNQRRGASGGPARAAPAQ